MEGLHDRASLIALKAIFEGSRHYPIARRVRAQAIAAAEAADGKLSAFQERIWLTPAMTDATPTTPAIKANVTKNPVAAFPIGKYMGEKCAGRSNPGPAICTPPKLAASTYKMQWKPKKF